jgi:hypothetical protein
MARDQAVERHDATFKPVLSKPSSYPLLVEPGCPAADDAFHTDDHAKQCSGRAEAVLLFRTGLNSIASPPAFISVPGQVRGPVNIVFRTDGIVADWLMDRRHWQRLSSALPPWIFAYMPTERADLAVIFHEGRRLDFVSPAVGEPAGTQ